jgi:circadian clock protein KaiC
MATDSTGRPTRRLSRTPSLPKTRTGIAGLDEITGGGLPAGRPTLVCGGAGSGKTLLAMEFLARGATQFDEPGVFMAFEERAGELETNFASLGFDLKALVSEKRLILDFVRVEPAELEEAGSYDLDGLFIRLGSAIDSVNAKRVVLDTIETLFSGLRDTAVLRAELRRLFHWLKTKGVTAVITAERGEDSLTRYGLEEYVADCVILLDNRVEGQMATRRLRIVKYRGSSHGTNEYPFLIDEGGISIMPLTSLAMDYRASTKRVSTGVPRLDAMMGGRGFYRGSSVLVSGRAGTGKTSLAAHFAQATAERGERCLWFAFEESPGQIIRNMRSIGIDLAPAVKSGQLRLIAIASTSFGLEMHLVAMHKAVNEFDPQSVVLDPVSNFSAVGSDLEIKTMLMRLVGFLKSRQITSLFTHLVMGGTSEEATSTAVSSLMDTWLLVQDVVSGAERNRVLQLLKSRGMDHSNQVREFLITDHGVDVRDVYVGASGELLAGSALIVQRAREAAQALAAGEEIDSLQRELDLRRQAVEAQVAEVQAAFEIEQTRTLRTIAQGRARAAVLQGGRAEMSEHRQADAKSADDTAAPEPGSS